MFAIIAIIAWAIVLIACVLFIGLSSLMMYVNIAIHGGNTNSFVSNFNDSAVVKFLNGSIYNDGGKISNFFFGSGTASDLNLFQLYIFPIIMLVVFAFVAVISIIEFSRNRNMQRISKPFIKPIIFILITFSFILGKNLNVIVGSMLMVSIILMEILLFDVISVNNFAEETNLTSMHREESKFKKEVLSAGKLKGNASSEEAKLMDLKQKNDQKVTIDLAKTNDNVLPNTDLEELDNSKYKKYHKEWEKYHAQLEKFKSKIEQKIAEDLSESHQKKLIEKYNVRVENLNKIAKELNLSDSFVTPLMSFNQESKLSDSINLQVKSVEDGFVDVEETPIQELPEIKLEFENHNQSENVIDSEFSNEIEQEFIQETILEEPFENKLEFENNNQSENVIDSESLNEIKQEFIQEPILEEPFENKLEFENVIDSESLNEIKQEFIQEPILEELFENDLYLDNKTKGDIQNTSMLNQSDVNSFEIELSDSDETITSNEFNVFDDFNKNIDQKDMLAQKMSSEQIKLNSDFKNEIDNEKNLIFNEDITSFESRIDRIEQLIEQLIVQNISEKKNEIEGFANIKKQVTQMSNSIKESKKNPSALLNAIRSEYKYNQN